MNARCFEETNTTRVVMGNRIRKLVDEERKRRLTLWC